MTIRWTTERVSTWMGGALVETPARAAARWRLRVLSDRRGPAPRAANFDAIFTTDGSDFDLWVRPFRSGRPYGSVADGDGVSLQVVENTTQGLRHELSVRIKPGDESTARWSCSCGTAARHATVPELAREEAEAHAAFATDASVRLRDRAVAQGADGRWSQVEVAVAQRFRACIRSELSAVAVHKKGIGEEFELVVDGRLELWTRRLCGETALRKDEDGRGVSLLTFDAPL